MSQKFKKSLLLTKLVYIKRKNQYFPWTDFSLFLILFCSCLVSLIAMIEFSSVFGDIFSVQIQTLKFWEIGLYLGVKELRFLKKIEQIHWVFYALSFNKGFFQIGHNYQFVYFAEFVQKFKENFWVANLLGNVGQ